MKWWKISVKIGMQRDPKIYQHIYSQLIFDQRANIIQLKYSFYFSNFQFQDPDEYSLNCDAKTFLWH